MIEIFYWILLLIWLVLGFPSDRTVWPVGRHFILFVLFVLLGLKVFGNPLGS